MTRQLDRRDGGPGRAQVGGVLPEPLPARQAGAHHPRRELHRQLLVGGVRQGRHRHLGAPGHRLPATRGGPAPLRAAGLPAGHLLLVVPLLADPGEVPLRPRRADRHVPPGQARGTSAIRSTPGPPSRTTPSGARRYQEARGKGGFRRISWDEALEIAAASTIHTIKEHGPDRVAGFSPIPAMSQVSYAAGSRFMSLHRRRGHELLRLVLRPAAGLAGDLGRADRRARVGRLVQRPLRRGHGRQPQHDPHPRHPLHLRGAPRRGQARRVFSPDFSQVAKYADWWIPSNPGQDTAFWLAVNHVLLTEFYRDRQVDYFQSYAKQYTDLPFLVEIDDGKAGQVPAGRPARAATPRSRTATGRCSCGTTRPTRLACPTAPSATAGPSRTRATGTSSCSTGSSATRSAPAQLHRPPRRRGRDRARVLRRRRHHHALGAGAHDADRRRAGARSPPCSTCSWPASVSTGACRATTPPSYDDDDVPYTPAWQEQYTGHPPRHGDRVRPGVGPQRRADQRQEHDHHRRRRQPLVPQQPAVPVGHHRADADRLGRRQRRRSGPLRRPGEAGQPGVVGLDRLRARLGDGAPPPEHARRSTTCTPTSGATSAATASTTRCPTTIPSASTTRSTTRHGPCARAGCRSSPSSTRTRSTSCARRAAGAPRPTRPWSDRHRRAPEVRRPRVRHRRPRRARRLAAHLVHLARQRHRHLGQGPRVLHAALPGHRTRPPSRPSPRTTASPRSRSDPTPRSGRWTWSSTSTSAWTPRRSTPTSSCRPPPGTRRTTSTPPTCTPSSTRCRRPCRRHGSRRSDWEIFKALAEKVSELAGGHLPGAVEDVVMQPLTHDTPDEIAQPEVADWRGGRGRGDTRADDAQVQGGQAGLRQALRADGVAGRRGPRQRRGRPRSADPRRGLLRRAGPQAARPA